MDLHTGSRADENCNPVKNAILGLPVANPLDFGSGGIFRNKLIKRSADVKLYVESSKNLKICNNLGGLNKLLRMSLMIDKHDDDGGGHPPPDKILSCHLTLALGAGNACIFNQCNVGSSTYVSTDFTFNMTKGTFGGQTSISASVSYDGAFGYPGDTATATLSINNDGTMSLSGDAGSLPTDGDPGHIDPNDGGGTGYNFFWRPRYTPFATGRQGPPILGDCVACSNFVGLVVNLSAEFPS